jgi:hypothetical protein
MRPPQLSPQSHWLRRHRPVAQQPEIMSNLGGSSRLLRTDSQRRIFLICVLEEALSVCYDDENGVNNFGAN